MWHGKFSNVNPEMFLWRDSRKMDDAMIRFTRQEDLLVHAIKWEPRRSKWGSTRCGALFQWSLNAECQVIRVGGMLTCLTCIVT